MSKEPRTPRDPDAALNRTLADLLEATSRLRATSRQQTADSDRVYDGLTRLLELLGRGAVVLALVALSAACGRQQPEPRLTVEAAPNPAAVGAVVVFTATPPAGVEPLAFEWTLGEGSRGEVRLTAHGRTSHRFPSPGLRSVSASAIAHDGGQTAGAVIVAVVSSPEVR